MYSPLHFNLMLIIYELDAARFIPAGTIILPLEGMPAARVSR